MLALRMNISGILHTTSVLADDDLPDVEGDMILRTIRFGEEKTDISLESFLGILLE